VAAKATSVIVPSIKRPAPQMNEDLVSTISVDEPIDVQLVKPAFSKIDKSYRKNFMSESVVHMSVVEVNLIAPVYE
jgi:hypothetical protein